MAVGPTLKETCTDMVCRVVLLLAQLQTVPMQRSYRKCAFQMAPIDIPLFIFLVLVNLEEVSTYQAGAHTSFLQYSFLFTVIILSPPLNMFLALLFRDLILMI